MPLCSRSVPLQPARSDAPAAAARPDGGAPAALPEPDAVAAELAAHLAGDAGAAADFVAGLRAYLRRDAGKLRWLLQPMAAVAAGDGAPGDALGDSERAAWFVLGAGSAAGAPPGAPPGASLLDTLMRVDALRGPVQGAVLDLMLELVGAPGGGAPGAAAPAPPQPLPPPPRPAQRRGDAERARRAARRRLGAAGGGGDAGGEDGGAAAAAAAAAAAGVARDSRRADNAAAAAECASSSGAGAGDAGGAMPASVAAAAAAAGIPASVLALVEKAAPLSVAEYRSSVLALRGKLEGACSGAGATGGADAGLSLSPRGGLAALEAAGAPDAPAAGAAWLELAELQARAGAAAAAAGADGDAVPTAEPAAAEPAPRADAPPGPSGQAPPPPPPPPPEAAAADADAAGEAVADGTGRDDAEGSVAGTDGGEEPCDARAPERKSGAAGPELGVLRSDSDGAASGAGAEEVLALAVGWLRGAAAARGGGGGGGADAHAAPDAVPKIAALLSGARPGAARACAPAQAP